MITRPGTRWYPRPGRRIRGDAVQDPLFEVVVRPEVRYYRQILDALTRSGFPGIDQFEASVVVSKILGTVWAGQVRRDGEAEETFGLGLIDYVRQRHAPAATALLRALASLAPIREVRAAAAAVAEPWTLPVPGRCWALDDAYGDQSTLVCEFSPASDHHALVVLVDHARLSVATDALLTHEVDALIRDLTNDARTSHGLLTLRQVEPDWARGLLDRAFARTDLIEGVRTTSSYADLRALAMARLRLLPPSAFTPSVPAEPGWVGAAFLASPQASVLPSDPSVREVVRGIATFFARYEVVGVGPVRWEVFVAEWRSGPMPVVLPAVARAFTEWAGLGANLSETAMAELVAVLDDLLPLP